MVFRSHIFFPMLSSVTWTIYSFENKIDGIKIITAELALTSSLKKIMEWQF